MILKQGREEDFLGGNFFQVRRVSFGLLNYYCLTAPGKFLTAKRILPGAPKGIYLGR